MAFLSNLSKLIVEKLSELGVYYTVLTTVVGAISVVILFLSYQMKTRGKILATYIGSATGWAIYFTLMGDLTSAVLNLIGIARSIVFLQREKHRWANSLFWLFFFIAVMMACTLATFASWKDLFPLVGNILGTISFYVLNETLLRALNVGTYCMWLGNSVSKGFLMAIISDSFALISCVISLIRYRKKEEVSTEQSSPEEEVPLQESDETIAQTE